MAKFTKEHSFNIRTWCNTPAKPSVCAKRKVVGSRRSDCSLGAQLALSQLFSARVLRKHTRVRRATSRTASA